MRKKASRTPNRRALMEELEPRLLFSADLPGVLAQSGLLGGDAQPTPPAIVSLVEVPSLGVAIGTSEQTSSQVAFTLSESKASVQPKKELVFVDAGAPNYHQLIFDLMKVQAEGRHIEVVVLETGRDGIEQIGESMAERRDVSAVHIVSHGSDGSLKLGNTKLSAYNLEKYRDAIASWQESLTEGADLLIYGCDFAGSAQGREIVESLSALTGADVAASTDKTGHVNLGGDWELEHEVGAIEVDIAFSSELRQDWQGVMNFTEVGGAAGVQGPTDPSGSGNGVAFADFNNDGFYDFVVHGNATTPSVLYENDGDGTFTDVTAAKIPGLSLGGNERRSVVWGDVNNDGWQDLISLDGADAWEVYLNNGSDFGVTGLPNQTVTVADYPDGLNVEGIGLIDYDNDGDLDFIHDNHDFGVDLFENNGSGFFSYVDPTTVGLPASSPSAGDYSTFVDIDVDGYVDIIIRKDGVGVSDFYRNNGNGTFSAAFDFGLAPNSFKGGVVAGDFDNDGDFDVVWTDAEGTSGNLLFEWTGATFAAGVVLPFGGGDSYDGVAAGDYDNDGDLDLFLNGADAGGLLLINDSTGPGNFTFSEYTAQSLGAGDGEGTGFVDIDNDGDLDLAINQSGNNELWRNDADNSNYLMVNALRDLGGGVTRAELGATIVLRDWDGNVISGVREVNGGRGHGSQDPAIVHFGLPQGPNAKIYVEVRFLDGSVVTREVIPTSLGSYRVIDVLNTDTSDAIVHDPVVNDQSFSVDENSSNATSVGTVVATDPDEWFDINWGFRKAITIDSTQVSADLTDFPVLISLASDVQLAANVGFADGRDIFFTLADGTMLLDHEIELFNDATGQLVAWVRVPNLSSTVDTTLYMYYGNAGASDQQNAAGVWDASYAGVWHLGEDPSAAAPQINDSTSNANDGTTEGTWASSDSIDASIGKGLRFDGTTSSRLIRVPDSTSLDSTNDAATFSLWMNWTNSVDGDHQIIMSSSNRYTAGLNDGYEWAVQGDGDYFVYPWGGDGSNYNMHELFGGPSPFTNNVWHHLAVTLDFATKEVKSYLNGTSLASTVENVPALWTTLASPDDWLWGGNPDRANRYFDGVFDEIRVADVVRSADWIATSHENQRNPGTFVALGTEQPFSASAGLTYAITGGTGSTAFAIDANTGEITVADSAQLDYETTPSFGLTVQVTDSSGLSDTAAITVNLNDLFDDVTPPTAPTVVSQTTNNSQPTITGTYDSTDAAGGFTVMVDSVIYTLGTDPELTAVGNSWSLNLAAAPQTLADGIYDVVATATDGSSNSASDVTAGEVTVDTIAPAAPSVDLLPGSDTGMSNTDNVTSDTTPTVRVALNGAGSTAPVVGDVVEVFSGVTSMGMATLTATDIGNGFADITLSPLGADGAKSLTATVTDGVSNASAASAALMVAIDTTATVTVTTPVSGDGAINATEATSVSIGGTVAGVENGRTVTVTIDDGVNPVVSGTATLAGGAFTVTGLDVSSLNDGALTITASVTDLAGNLATDNTAPATLDKTAPSAPTVATLTTNSNQPTITGTYDSADAAGGFTVTVDATTYTLGVDMALTTAGNSWSLDLLVSGQSLVDGTYSVTATVIDAAGSATSDPTASELVVDTTAPTLVANTGSTAPEGGTDGVVMAELNYVDALQPAASVAYTVTASPANGRLELSSAPGVAITSLTQADINAGLVQYVHDGSEAAGDSFTFNVTDGVGGTVVGQTFAFTVTAVNDAPVNTVPGSLNTGLDAPIVFSGANLITVSDVDAGPAPIQVNLVVGGANGTLSLATTAALAIGPGADGSSAMTLTGTLAAINAALNGMTFAPNSGFQGATSVQITTSDLGNTGLAGPQMDIDTVNITVANTAPTVNDQVLSIDENSALGALVGTVIATDPDPADPLTYTILSGNTGGAFSIDPATGQLRVTNPTLLDFESNPSFTLRVRVTDSGAPALSDTANVTIQLYDLLEGAVTPPDPGPGPVPPPPPPDPVPEPEPDPDSVADDGEVDFGGGDDGGGSPAPQPTPEPAPDPAPEPEPVVEPVPEPVAAPEPAVEAAVQPEPVAVKAEPREAERPKLAVVAKPIDVSREAEQTRPFRQALNVMSEDVGSTDILGEMQHNTVHAAFKGGSFVLSAGFLTWALRGASLLASVAASLPAWQGFDPLPVLAAKKRDTKTGDDERNDDERKQDDWQEKRIQRLLDAIDPADKD